MAYNEFTIDTLEAQFGLRTDMHGDHFAAVAPVAISDWLRESLQRGMPLALAIGTEKARSELLITPILLEAVQQRDQQVSFFSGVEFTVDSVLGLRDVVDYLISLSPEQLTVKAPVVAIVEAKNDNIRSGTAQCMAEMVAAQIFNRERGNEITTICGVVTTGSVWQFLRLIDTTVYVDKTEYYLKEAEKIVAVLVAMVQEAMEAQSALS